MILEELTNDIKALVNDFLGLFKPVERKAIVTIHSSDTTISIKKAKSIAFINKDTATVTVKRIPLAQGESISFSPGSADTITDTFTIVFSSTGTKKVYVTTIK